MNRVVVPLKDNAVLVLNKGAEYYSIVISGIQDSALYEYVSDRYEDARVSLHKQFLRLDFDKDGVVSLQDCKKAAGEILEAIRDYHYRERGLDLYERARLRARALMVCQ